MRLMSTTGRQPTTAVVVMALVATGCGLGDGEAVGGWCRSEVVASVDDPEGTMRLVRVRPGGEVTEIAVEWPDDEVSEPASRPILSRRRADGRGSGHGDYE